MKFYFKLNIYSNFSLNFLNCVIFNLKFQKIDKIIIFSKLMLNKEVDLTTCYDKPNKKQKHPHFEHTKIGCLR